MENAMNATQNYGPVPHYIVMTAAASMPSFCWGSYGKVAVVETDGVNMPKQINPNHKALSTSCVASGASGVGNEARCLSGLDILSISVTKHMQG